MRLFVATTNAGKLRDFASVDSQRHLIRPLPDLRKLPVPVEDRDTFQGNASLKAVFYSLHAPGEIVIADDSGIEVDALVGAPGVRSARYADDSNFPAPPGTSADTRNNLCLIAALAAVPEGKRQARYRCALTAARDGVIIAAAEGSVEGEILTAPRGERGFGYDPLFYIPSLGKTMAELDDATRLSLSHRGAALRNLLPLLSRARQPRA